jgi:alkylation response protein AidB-like acyl-CoA dehydrogenase
MITVFSQSPRLRKYRDHGCAAAPTTVRWVREIWEVHVDDQAGGGPGDASAVLERARRLAADVLAPAATTVDSRHLIPPAHFDLLAAQGFYGVAGPREYGGLEMDFRTGGMITEVFAGACLSTTFVWMQHHGVVLAVAGATDGRLREEWLEPLCTGRRRAGVALAGTLPGPPLLRARPVAGGYVFDGVSPWVTGWGHIGTLYTAGRDEQGNIVWALLDAEPSVTLSVEPLQMVAVMASSTVRAHFNEHFVPADRVTAITAWSEWRRRDAGGLRGNGSLALGITARCCELIGPGPLDGELVSCRAALDDGTSQTMPAARAAACELAMRATAALIVHQGSQAILMDHHAQRLAREALFLLVFGSRPTIKAALGGLLDAPGHRSGRPVPPASRAQRF